ncbi:MAG: hypothetical protein JWR38_5540 [Mucilaginibacter sp.]|nr:hypothetical protein [Mucilaginibacter sp.]
MYEIKETGGAKIGMAHASWPFATLKVTRDKLELNASIIGNLQFRPTDVISIEPCGQIFKNGIKINHLVKAYNSQVIFTTSNPGGLIHQIEQTGFLSNKDPLPAHLDMEIIAAQSKGGFPIKTPVAIAIVIIWNILILSNFFPFFKAGAKGFPFLGAQLALGFILMLSVALIVSEPVRNIVLKEGRTLKDIKTFVYFLMFLSAIMLICFSIIPH